MDFHPIKNKLQQKREEILYFKFHIFWNDFEMGPHAVDQMGFKGTVYAEIRKSIFYNIFDLVQLHGLLALYYKCRRYCSIRCDT